MPMHQAFNKSWHMTDKARDDMGGFYYLIVEMIVIIRQTKSK